MSKLSVVTIDAYREIGGNAWKCFLKEIYEWFEPPFIGDKYDYKLWLKNHSGQQLTT